MRQPVYTEEEKRMIPSRLPFRHAFRMGAASIRLKPVAPRVYDFSFRRVVCRVRTVFHGDVLRRGGGDGGSAEKFADRISELSGAYAARQTTWRTLNGEKKQEGTEDVVVPAALSDEQYLSLNEEYPGSIAVFGDSEWITGLTLEDDRFYYNFYQGFAYTKDDSGIEMLAGGCPKTRERRRFPITPLPACSSGKSKTKRERKFFWRGTATTRKFPFRTSAIRG